MVCFELMIDNLNTVNSRRWGGIRKVYKGIDYYQLPPNSTATFDSETIWTSSVVDHLNEESAQ